MTRLTRAGIGGRLREARGGGSGARLKQAVDVIRASKYPDRFRVFANVDWNGAGGPGWREKAVAELEQAIKDGAIGLKVAKNLGLTARKADGSRLKVDDPELDPIWETCARLNASRCSSTWPTLRRSSSRSTTGTSAGSSWRSFRIARIRPSASRTSRN